MRLCVYVLFALFIYVVSSCVHFRRTIFPKNPHIAALILARGGSKGIKLKNIQTVNGQTLLARAIYQIKQVNFDSVWVSTDHPAVYREAETFNVNVHWRKPETATDEASSLFATQEFLQAHPVVDIVALIQCTSPFLKKHYLDQARRLIRQCPCVFSVSRSFKLFWKGNSGDLSPLNFNLKARPRRQELSEQFTENGMFYFANRKMVEEGYFQTSR